MTEQIIMLSPLQEHICFLLRNGPMSREELMLYTKAPRTTIYDNIVRMPHLVKKFTRCENARGRPVVWFKLKEAQP